MGFLVVTKYFQVKLLGKIAFSFTDIYIFLSRGDIVLFNQIIIVSFQQLLITEWIKNICTT